MKKLHRILICFSLLLLSVEVIAQTSYQLSGTLVEEGKSEKIFYATVVLVTPDSTARTVASTFSGADGKFVLTDIPSGSYVVKASLIGYDMLSLPVEISGSEVSVDLGEIGMKKGGMTLAEVQVVGKKPVYMIDGEKTLYNVSEDPAIQSGNASDALQNAPGVEVDVNGNITLRGVSSVEIWLNNKPSNMNEAALKEFIRQLPANSIEKIEVITNPSARYSAKGSGGIINIVTSSAIKKNSFLSFGVNGSSSPYINPFLSYVYSDEKFSISSYLVYSLYEGKYDSDGAQVSFNEEGDTSNVLQTKSNSRSFAHNPGIFLHGSYQIDSANLIYFWGGGYGNIYNTNAAFSAVRREYIFSPDSYNYNYKTTEKGWSSGGYAGAWYEHQFKREGHKISADVGYDFWTSKSKSLSLRDYDETHNYLDQTRNKKESTLNQNFSLSLDYTIPYHKNGKIELGFAGEYGTDADVLYTDTLEAGTQYLYNVDSLRIMDYNAYSGSAGFYATIEHRFGNFTIKGGLRTEYDGFDMKYINSPKDNRIKGYWGLYPSLHLSYRTESMHNFKLSYTRRVVNPSARNITSFITYSDDDFSTGNPDLRQTFTNSIEAGWTKYIIKFGNIGLNAYFKNSKDQVGTLADVVYNPYFGRIVMFSKPINAGKTMNTGAELNVTYQLKAFMNIRFYANMYYMKSSFQFRDEAELYKVDNLGYSFRLNFWAKLWKVLEVNASANYSSKSVSLFTVTKPRYSIDFGLRAEFWKRRISVYANVNDIFNWNKMSTQDNNPYYVSNSTSRNNWMGRSIVAGISFKFGRLELESQAQQPQQPQMGGQR